MTMTPAAERSDHRPLRDSKATITIEHRSWGYAVHSKGGHAFAVVLTQLVAAAAGASGTIIALALMVLPSMAVLPGMQIGAAVIILAMSFFFMWYATRGLDLWVEVDLHLGEIREVTNSRMGRKSVLGRYGFDGIADIASIPSDKSGEARIYLVNHSKSAFLCVADGPRGEATEVASRLRTDLLLSRQPPVTAAASQMALQLAS